jgi:hypothetical protein
MRRIGIVAVLSLMALALAAVPAFAGSPHFIKSQTFSSLDGANLRADFKEAGLPSGATETVTLSASETVTYECVNGGGKNPSASNKRAIRTSGSTSGEFSADKNGNIVGSLTLEPASAASVGFSCPSGQTVTFVSVSYTNVTLTDIDSGATIRLANQSYTNPDAPPLGGK